MAEYGLGNFIYEVTFDGKTANFKFRDPDDVTNVADVSVSDSDFPEGITQPDSRQVADVAYTLVAKQLNDKRDARLKQETLDATENQLNHEAKQREIANDFFDKTEELSDNPVQGVHTDGDQVQETKSDKKKK